MTTTEALDHLRSRILSEDTLLFLQTWEEDRWEGALAALALEIERGIVVWSATTGAQPPLDGEGDSSCTPLEFLERVEKYPPDHLFLLKDFHPYLADPLVVRKLRDLASRLATQHKTLMFIGPTNTVPLDLKKDVARIELPLPGFEEIRKILADVMETLSTQRGQHLQPTEDESDRLIKAVLGLTAPEASKAFRRCLLGKERIDDDVFAALVAEKRESVEGSDLLDFYDLDESVGDVGGLDNLKDWLARRADAFSIRAREQGIPTPKGVLLLGVQGCGKSLTARAAARLLSFPLVRLDVANLLSGEVGASEKNMRDVLRLIGSIAPAVLWVDEIEKGFAGVAGDAVQDATMSRLVGSFLTWMGELDVPVFVVATANSVNNLPPELLRRGRFDEMFFIDLPNYDERKEIFSIHLAKRGWKPEKYDVGELASQTEGFSGAEIEQIVISAMLDAYGAGQILGQPQLLDAREQTVPLSVTMEERIFELREWASSRCRRATPDSRVTQMLDEETRAGYLDDEDEVSETDELESWAALAEHGQLNAAIVDYCRENDYVTFPQLLEAFAPYLETSGDQGISLKSDPSIVLWAGMSQPLCEALVSLIGAKRLHVHPGDAETYRALGKALKLPVLSQLPDERVEKPVWLPCTLRIMPTAIDNLRLGRVGRIKVARPKEEARA